MKKLQFKILFVSDKLITPRVLNTIPSNMLRRGEQTPLCRDIKVGYAKSWKATQDPGLCWHWGTPKTHCWGRKFQSYLRVYFLLASVKETFLRYLAIYFSPASVKGKFIFDMAIYFFLSFEKGKFLSYLSIYFSLAAAEGKFQCCETIYFLLTFIK